MIQIANDGIDIKSTNYWDTEHAMRGICFLSGNAGAWRLLVPPEAETMLAEMRTGKSVTIESSVHQSGFSDVVFEDGTESPFSVALHPSQIDRAVKAGNARLTVWTRRGKELELPCSVKT